MDADVYTKKELNAKLAFSSFCFLIYCDNAFD